METNTTNALEKRLKELIEIQIPAYLSENGYWWGTTIFIIYAIYRFGSFLLGPKLPPGPWGFPVVGVLPLLFFSKKHLKIQEWWARYGDCMSFKMGSRRVVVVSGKEAMGECFNMRAPFFEDRPDSYLKKITRGKGLMWSEGEEWKEHRSLAMSCLRELGMGSIDLERDVQEEIRYMLQEFLRYENKPVDPASQLSKSVSNIICQLTYGSRFEYDDEVFQSNLTALQQSVRHQSLISLINFLPFLEFLPKILPKDRLLARNVRLRDQYAAEQLERHREAVDAESPRDFIDAYLARMNKLMGQKRWTSLSEENLRRSVQDLFIAGTEPITTTLKWALLLMAIHRPVQAKVQAEIELVIGSGRLPSVRDRESLSYTEAALLECQRVGNISLFNVPRAASEDTWLCGYKIPKGTWVFANRWGLHMSPRYWKEPEKFMPERFFHDGKINPHTALYPYGMGTRSCVGESLARMELFLFFASILQAFHVSLPEGEPSPSLEPEFGLNLSPKPYKIIFTCR